MTLLNEMVCIRLKVICYSVLLIEFILLKVSLFCIISTIIGYIDLLHNGYVRTTLHYNRSIIVYVY